MSIVYLLHLDPPYKHAAHYAGYVNGEGLFERLQRHRAGNGARLCRVAVAAGSNLMLARVWYNAPRMFETTIKKRSLRKLCPICNGPAALRRKQ